MQAGNVIFLSSSTLTRDTLVEHPVFRKASDIVRRSGEFETDLAH
jgi:hypothetical protein